MTDDEIKAAAMALASELNLPLAAGMVAYEKIVAFGMSLLPPPPKKKGAWSPETLAKFRAKLAANPERQAQLRALGSALGKKRPGERSGRKQEGSAP